MKVSPIGTARGLRSWRATLALALVVLLAVETLWQGGWLRDAEHVQTDLWHSLSGVRQEPRHVALVTVDDWSLAAFSDEPLAFWSPHFARALDVLRQAGARLVIVDFILNSSPQRWLEKLGAEVPARLRNFDQPFLAQISQGAIVLAAFRIGDGREASDYILPSPEFLLALPQMDVPGHVGLANLHLDKDGMVRRFALGGSLAPEGPAGAPRLSLAALAATRLTGQPVDGSLWRYPGRELTLADLTPIAYAGPPGTFRPLSFHRLLAPDALADADIEALAGKVVILGAGFAGMNDAHPTPYSAGFFGRKVLMPGQEIQANVLETLLSGRVLQPLPTTARLLLIGGVLLAIAWLGTHWRPWRTLLATLLVAVLLTALAWGLFLYDLVLPLIHLYLALAALVLATSLLRLTREERERARIGDLFGRYVSEQVLAQLLATPEKPRLGGQSVHITVLFSDIRNFTTLSEKLAAEEVVEMLNAYFERACRVLLDEGATIDKFIGDAIMAEFGAPLPQADHAARALRAALALRRVAVDFRHWMRARFAGRDLPEFDIGIGLHSGKAVVGNIGSSARMQYTAIGDTVNIASRLEGKTKEVGSPILASEETVRAADGQNFTLGERHVLYVKGRVEPVTVYALVSD